MSGGVRGFQSIASRSSTRRTQKKSETGEALAASEQDNEKSLFSSVGSSGRDSSTDHESSDHPSRETADQLASIQHLVLHQHEHGLATDTDPEPRLPLAPEEETLKQVCFRAESECRKFGMEGPKLPVELGHLEPLQAMEEARKLSAGNAQKVLQADVKWTQAYVYCKPHKVGVLKQMTLRPKDEAVQKFKDGISRTLMKVISKLDSFELPGYPGRHEELSEKEIQQLLRIIIFLHKAARAEPEESPYKSPSPVDVLPRFVRGQCEIVELKEGSFYDRFQDLNGNAYPFVFPEGTFSAAQHAVSTTEHTEMDSRVTLQMPKKAYAIQGHVAERMVVRPGAPTFQLAGNTDEKMVILTADTLKNAHRKSIESDVDDHRLDAGVPEARESEADLAKALDDLSSQFLTNWKDFQTTIESFDHGTQLFKDITAAIEKHARKDPNAHISEEDICHIIDAQANKHAKALGRPPFSDVEKISMFVNYQALLAAQKVSIKPFIASGFSLAGDVLHLVPVLGYGSLAFAGVSLLMEYAESRHTPITIDRQQTLTHAPVMRDLTKVNADQKWWQKLSPKNHRFSDKVWWKELKAAGPLRVGFEGVKFLPVVGKAATILSIVLEMKLIAEKVDTYKDAKREAKVAKASRPYVAMRQLVQDSDSYPHAGFEFEV